jgi:hypothetical protein
MKLSDQSLIDLLRDARDQRSEVLVSARQTNRLVRFARHAAPIVRKQRVRRLCLATGLTLVGSAGTAAAAWNGIRIGGIEIFQTQAPSSSAPAGRAVLPGSPIVWPGEPVTGEEAKSRYNARIRLPSLLKAPSSMYWLVPPSTGQITAVWKPSRTLPKTDNANIGLLLSQFRGTSVDQRVIAKFSPPPQPSRQPSITPQTPQTPQSGTPRQPSGGQPRIEQTRVNDEIAWFLSGPSHVVLVDDGSGLRADSARLAGNTLIWTSKGFTYRLEGNLTLKAAVRLAESVR